MDETKDKSTQVVEEHEASKKERKNKQKEHIEQLENEVTSLKDKLLRNAAELENFKKRMHQERITDRKYASKNLILELLNPLDQLDRIVSMTTDNELLKSFLVGFKMINDQFFNTLQADGVKEIEALNKPFDPNIHHAIEKIEDKEKENGLVLEVIQKGYYYKDQLLRPAMVKVNEWSEENGKDK
ncbi:MAG: nucleotide exchange factor GrpE [Acholeplasmataceae bacterium]|jgi:molecular chaperone GrpE|nr:nucleotide exchange factor GrpE [Acholeplasmataceae bacterium]